MSLVERSKAWLSTRAATLRVQARTQRGAWIRTGILTLLLLAALAFFARFTHHHEAIETWVFWRYAGYWVLCLYWGAGCLSAGDAVLRRLLPGRLPLREHLATAFALGVVLYYFISSVAGLLYLYGKAFFWLVPLLMFASGARGLIRTLRRFVRHVRHARKTIARPSAWYVFPILMFGIIGFGMIYFEILTPDNVQFDSRWKHFALAEQYVVEGGIRRFPEGWTVETNPHLATFVYHWGFQLPYGELFDRVELAAHLEFFVFVITTLSISALVRKLVPGLRVRHMWVVRFLFPGVFLYDSSLSGGADHIAALFTVPMFLLVLRGYKDLSWRYTGLVGLMTAGAAMTKLTCLLMFVPVASAVYFLRGLWLMIRPPEAMRRVRVLIGPAVAFAAALVATSTFWLKNWVFYGDPLYPSLYPYLKLRPWTPDSANLFIWAYKDRFVQPDRTWAGLLETLGALFSFSFDPHDYARYHGNVPVIGSLFTLLLIVLFFYPRKAKRAWGLAAAAHVAIFVWYWIHHEDRYLQSLMPWMAAVTATSIVLAWRSGFPARAAVSLLIAFQIVWGGDVYFLPNHAMAGSPIKKSVDFLGGTYKKDKNRFKTYDSWAKLGRSIPKGSRVLLHDNHVHLGLGHSTVSDWNAWQFGMSYARHPKMAQTHELMTSMGVTHIVWERQKTKGWDSIAGDIVFFNYAMRSGGKRSKVGNFEIAEMPKQAPTGPDVEWVLYLGCGKPVRSGLYRLQDLSVSIFGPNSDKYRKPRESSKKPDGLVGKADAIVLETKCHRNLPAGAQSTFELVAKRKAMKHFKRAKELQIWLPRKGAAPIKVDASDPSTDLDQDLEAPDADLPPDTDPQTPDTDEPADTPDGDEPGIDG